MLIQTENTPNPNAVKFLPGKTINENSPVHFNKLEECYNSTLAKNLLSMRGVKSVFFGLDFITITKDDAKEWSIIKPEILMIIMDHFVSGAPVFDHGKKEVTDNLYNEIEKQIVEIIDNMIRPSVAMDGGDITFQKFENGTVYLTLRGACSGCPSSEITLKQGIESMLKHYVPEVETVEAAKEEEGLSE